MTKLALFDLDHTLLPLDSDYEWGQFLVRTGAVEPLAFKRANDAFYAQYLAGTLDAVDYLGFALGTLARFTRRELDAMHRQFMLEVIAPAIRPQARALLQQHQDNGDLVVIITATNHFVTAPIAAALKVEHLIAALPEQDGSGNLTGKLIGNPTSGAGKVEHIHAWLASRGTPLMSFESSHFYSDSHNDLPLLSIVSHPIATNPDATLARHAARLGWTSLQLFHD